MNPEARNKKMWIKKNGQLAENYKLEVEKSVNWRMSYEIIYLIPNIISLMLEYQLLNSWNINTNQNLYGFFSFLSMNVH